MLSICGAGAWLAVLVCGQEPQAQDGAQISRYTYAALAHVPEKARARRNPFENRSEAVAAGRKLFALRCAECHGEDGRGSRRGPSLRARVVRQASDGELFWIVSNGVVRRGMPEWSRLPEAQRWQIVTFLKSLDAADFSWAL